MIVRQPLTKKLLMSLESGKYIASNTFKGLGSGKDVNSFHGYIPHTSEREKTWKLIKAAKADGRLFEIFESKEEYIEWFTKLKGYAHPE